MLAACNICFLKTINYIEVQKYFFGINGLSTNETGLLEMIGRPDFLNFAASFSKHSSFCNFFREHYIYIFTWVENYKFKSLHHLDQTLRFPALNCIICVVCVPGKHYMHAGYPDLTAAFQYAD